MSHTSLTHEHLISQIETLDLRPGLVHPALAKAWLVETFIELEPSIVTTPRGLAVENTLRGDNGFATTHIELQALGVGLYPKIEQTIQQAVRFDDLLLDVCVQNAFRPEPNMHHASFGSDVVAYSAMTTMRVTFPQQTQVAHLDVEQVYYTSVDCQRFLLQNQAPAIRVHMVPRHALLHKLRTYTGIGDLHGLLFLPHRRETQATVPVPQYDGLDVVTLDHLLGSFDYFATSILEATTSLTRPLTEDFSHVPNVSAHYQTHVSLSPQLSQAAALGLRAIVTNACPVGFLDNALRIQQGADPLEVSCVGISLTGTYPKEDLWQ